MSVPSENPLRSTILSLLRMLGDSDAQLAYERNVPIASVPAELVCMWFDDHYHPTTESFQTAFSRRERAILAAFHERYETVASSLPADLRRVADLQALGAWRTLMRDAVDTLRDLGEDAV